jgi:hypothetical protein
MASPKAVRWSHWLKPSNADWCVVGEEAAICEL